MTDSALQLDLSSLAGLDARALRLDQYAGLWAIEETHAIQLLQTVQSLDLRQHIALHAGQPVDRVAVEKQPVSNGGKIAVVSIEGTMTKYGSSMSSAGSTIRARQEIRKAAADPEISGILLRIDSPGGTVAGTADLASDVRQARTQKPVYTLFEDIGASAAYYVGSQADRVFANDAKALIGSIGTLMGLYDLSGRAGQLGIKPVVIKSGALKGTGFEGAEITGEQRAYLQELVDQHQQQFNQVVASARSVTVGKVAAEWATGRVWSADVAQSMGLIDGIQSLDGALGLMQQQNRKPSARAAVTVALIESPQPEQTMTTPNANTETTVQEVAAAPLSVPQIQAECAGLNPQSGDDARFVMEQLTRGATIEQVRKAWMETLTQRLQASQQQLQAVQTRPAVQAVPGVLPLVSGGSPPVAEAASASEEFWSAVAAKQKLGLSKAAAISKTVAEDPERHQQMIAEHNERARR